jgi:Cu/Ag efflux protein CusF
MDQMKWSRATLINFAKGLLLLAAALALAGCNWNRELQHYKLEGTVVSVETNVHEVTVNHKPIPGFMAAMRMTYVVKDQAALSKLKPGDEIKADLFVDRKNYDTWLEDIQVSQARSGASASTP